MRIMIDYKVTTLSGVSQANTLVVSFDSRTSEVRKGRQKDKPDAG